MESPPHFPRRLPSYPDFVNAVAVVVAVVVAVAVAVVASRSKFGVDIASRWLRR